MNPSVGRIVHFQRRNLGLDVGDEGQIESVAAIITKVHTKTLVNLTLFPPAGGTESVTSVYEGDPGDANTWIWPPRV